MRRDNSCSSYLAILLRISDASRATIEKNLFLRIYLDSSIMPSDASDISQYYLLYRAALANVTETRQLYLAEKYLRTSSSLRDTLEATRRASSTGHILVSLIFPSSSRVRAFANDLRR